jgi:hypothetical protein
MNPELASEGPRRGGRVLWSDGRRIALHQRDAVASILITGINIIAGFLVGVFQHGMELDRALTTYTVLTIGTGW